MKRSEFKKYIQEQILETLQEEDGSIITDDPDQAEELADKGRDVALSKDALAEDDKKKD